MFIVLLAASLIAHEPQLPPGVTCEMVREQVATYGYAKSIYWARGQGYSWKQINEARKCLK